MRTSAGVAALFVLSVAVMNAFGEEAPEVPFLPKAPRMDGTLSPDEWAAGFHVTEFKQFMPKEGEVPAPLRTEAWIGRTETTLCFAVRCYHGRMDQLVTQALDHDSSVWTDDSVEIFIDAQKTEFSYYHLIVNSAGTVYDAWNDGPGQGVTSWDSGAQAAAKVLKDGFSVEVAAPLAAINLGLNLSGEITLNIGRVIRYNKSQQTSFGQFHNPSSWKAFRFPPVGPKLWPVAAKGFKFGDAFGANEGTGQVRNLTAQEVNLIGEMVVEQKDKKQSAPVPLKLAPQEKAKVAINYTLADAGPAQIRLVWRNGGGREVLAVFRSVKPKPKGPVFVLPTE